MFPAGAAGRADGGGGPIPWLLSVRGTGVDGTRGEAVYLGPDPQGNCLCEETLEEQPGCVGCFMPRGHVAHHNWVFVGQGRGRYEPMQQFSFVGDGRGAWDRQEALVSAGMRFRKCWVALLVLPLLGGLFLLVCGVVSESVDGGLVMRRQTVIRSPNMTAGKSLIATPTHEPFDCTSGLQWPLDKKAWCCQMRGLGCTTQPPPLRLPQTTVEAYNCEEGYFNWKEVWSPARQAWCCVHRSRACHVATSPQLRLAPSLPSTTPPPKSSSTALATRLPTTAAPVQFDCGVDYTTCHHCLEKRWSVSKRTWCCQHMRRGCPTTPLLSYNCDEGYTDCYRCLQQRWSPAKRTWCCVHGGRGCSTTPSPPEPHDCGLQVGNWVLPWSDSRLAWCCKHRGVGCPSTTSAAARPAARSTPPPFDCKAGLVHWKRGWSVAKKQWCCDHEDRGCPHRAPGRSTSLPYDCEADYTTCYHCLQKRWSKSKRAWCCGHGGRGCAVTPAIAG